MARSTLGWWRYGNGSAPGEDESHRTAVDQPPPRIPGQELRERRARSPDDVGHVVRGEDRVGIRRHVGDGEELGEHRPFEEVGAAVDEGRPVASDGVVAPRVLREDASATTTQIIEGLDRL